MSDKFTFDEEFYPVPPSAVDADPAATIRELLYRVARLEQTLGEEHLQAVADMREVLLELVSLSDDVSNSLERWGVTTNAKEAAIVRTIVALGRKILAILDHHQVEAIEAVGQPLNPKTSDVVDTEIRGRLPESAVLREVEVGYAWPHGLLRRAQVVVSTRPEPEVEEVREQEADEEQKGETSPEEGTGDETVVATGGDSPQIDER